MFSKYLKNGISTGDNVLGFELDIEAYLDDSELIDSCTVSSNSEKECMIVAVCSYSQKHSEASVANNLKNIWMNCLRYQEFEKHSCEISKGKVVLHFCTVSGPLGVTGKIEAISKSS